MKKDNETKNRIKVLQKSAEDFRYLLNQGYPRRPSLELVGNRYQLTSDERHLLHRGVFSVQDSKSRRKKIVTAKEVRNRNLAIDGYNVLITIEAGLSGGSLVLGDDGFVRDISGVSGSFKKTETTKKALQLIFDRLRWLKPRRTLFLFDAPISRSGTLAMEVRNGLKEKGLRGDAMAVPVPEKMLIGFRGIIASSDTALIEQFKKVFDLAGDILRRENLMKTLILLKKKGGQFGRRG